MSLTKLAVRLWLYLAGAWCAVVMLAIGIGRTMPIPILAYVHAIPDSYPVKEIYILDANTGRIQPVFQSQGISNISWSPDGQRIAFLQRLDGSSVLNIVDVTGRNALELQVGDIGEAIWSPDGSRILYTSSHVPPEIFLVNLNGHVNHYGFPNVLTAFYRIQSIVWRPDSRRIAFISSRGDDSAVFTLDLFNDDIEEVAHNVSGELDDLTFLSLAWSPDGCCLAVASNVGLYTLTINDKSVEKIREGYYDHVDWSRDGRWLAIKGQFGETETAGIYILDLTTNNLIRLTYNYDDLYPIWYPLN